MLPREDLCWRHDGRLPTSLDDGSRGRKRHDRLSRSDVALQKAQHALRAGQVCNDVVHGLLLRMGEGVRQRLHDARTQAPFARGPAARLAPHVGAHKRKRQLAGKQFVVGKSGPGQVLRRDIRWRGRAVQTAQCLGEGRKLLARDPGLVLPFRQVRKACQCTVHRATHIAQRETLSQRIGRFDKRQRGEAGLVHDAVGMHHL